MGEKGAKMTNQSAEMADQLVAVFTILGAIKSKKMFGGHGIFCDDQMFCIVDSKGQAFLKCDKSMAEEMIAMGATKHGRMPYYTIPESVSGTEEELISMAKRSIAIVK